MSLLDAALNYARRGWRVLPLHNVEPNRAWCSCGSIECRRGGKNEKSVGKHPRAGNWQNDATKDEMQIRAWWAQWPHANIGIATGAGSDIVVLDIDVHRDAPGFESLEILETFLGKLPATLTAKTGSGGQHRLFHCPPSITICNSANWRGAPGIDWRGDGGQIVVAPSIALAGSYVWLNTTDVAELPAAWIDAHVKYEAERASKRATIARVVAEVQKKPSEVQLAEDEAVLDHMNAAANGEKFRLLWEGKLAEAGYISQSEADLAFCSMVAFWCDPDQPSPSADRIDRLLQQSALYRDKWERADYRTRTIALAVELEENRRASDASLRRTVEATAISSNDPPAPPPPPPPSVIPPSLRRRTRKHDALLRDLKKIAEDKIESDHTHLQHQGRFLSLVLQGHAIDNAALSDRVEMFRQAFTLIGFEMPDRRADEIVEMLREHVGREPAAEEYQAGAIAIANGHVQRQNWDKKAPVKEQARDEAKEKARLNQWAQVRSERAALKSR